MDLIPRQCLLQAIAGIRFVNLLLPFPRLPRMLRFAFHFLPKVGSRLVHTDNLREIDILYTFGNNDILAANVAKSESCFCLHDDAI